MRTNAEYSTWLIDNRLRKRVQTRDVCSCPGKRGHTEPSWTMLLAAAELAPEAIAIHVHDKCLKPNTINWLHSVKECPRCGDLFASPWEMWCEKCTIIAGEEWLGWKQAREKEVEFRRQLLGYKNPPLLRA